MFDWYDVVDGDEIKALSGNGSAPPKRVMDLINLLVKTANQSKTPLGVVQKQIGSTWRKVSISNGHFLDTPSNTPK